MPDDIATILQTSTCAFYTHNRTQLQYKPTTEHCMHETMQQ